MNDIEYKEWIKRAFHQLKTQQDLLDMINKIYRERFCSDIDDDVFKPISMKSLNYYKNVKASRRRRYRSFQIKKKSGKMRTINAPCRGLKIIQMCLNEIFQAFYEPNANACGFVKGRNIAYGAKKHEGKKYVYNIDLKDFFSSIELYRVKAILALPPFNMKDDKNDKQSLPYVIACLCCHPLKVERKDANGEIEIVTKEVLPQGAPTSPVLTNIVCQQMDRRLEGLARRFRATYTRYADDITFSARKNIFKPGSEFLTELRRIIEVNQHFTINDEKTRLQSSKYRQEVTGLVVNKHVNVTKRYVKQLRLWLYLWEHYGIDRASRYFLSHYMSDKGNVKRATAKIENVISGKLEYLRMIVGADNNQYKQLRQRYDRLVEDEPVVERKVLPQGQTPPPVASKPKNDLAEIADLLELLAGAM